MEMYQGSSTQQPAAICALKSPADAIHILEAVRLGIVPRVTRRLTGHERAMIRPGTVWVWEEEETNMRRWTDGRRWGASRVGGGGFLVYTESSESLSPPPSRSESPYPQGNGYYPTPSSSRRPESLIKQTYSTTMTHPVTGKVKKFHVVAYSSKRNPQGDAHNPLPLPHQLPALSSLKVTPGIWPEWENRRENEYPARRSMGPGGSLAPPSQSAPVTAMSSPSGPPYSVLAPPTAYPASAARPPSPGREAMYGPRPYPPPPPFPRGAYDNRGSPALPPPSGGPGPVRGPGGYPAPYPPPPRREGYDSPGGYPGRHMSQPPMYSSQASPHPHGGADRFHPYPVPPRSAGGSRIPSYPPSSGTSAPPLMPEGSMPDPQRGSPPQQYPFAYGRPSSSGNPRPYHEGSHETQRQPYSNGAPAEADPRRYPSEQPYNPGGEPAHHARHVSQPGRPELPPTTSPNHQAGGAGSLQPPRPEIASGRSPKMSISSTLLNREGSTAGAAGTSPGPTSAPAPGLTLPPLRSVEENRERRQDGQLLPSPSRMTPRAVSGEVTTNGVRGSSASMSPPDLNKAVGKKDWSNGEDARQLGELGRRVVL
ncbi:hypothetical protein IAU60_005901 [Kwoniella sp. DSM 27419]